jgi:hypothetical protein
LRSSGEYQAADIVAFYVCGLAVRPY